MGKPLHCLCEDYLRAWREKVATAPMLIKAKNNACRYETILPEVTLLVGAPGRLFDGSQRKTSCSLNRLRPHTPSVSFWSPRR